MKTTVVDAGCVGSPNIILSSQNYEARMFDTVIKIIFFIKSNASLIADFFCSRIFSSFKEFVYISDVVASNKTVKSLDSEVEKAYTQVFFGGD
jgi:hypothetical protein